MGELLRPEGLAVAAAAALVAAIVVEKTWHHPGFTVGGLLLARGFIAAVGGSAGALGFSSGGWFGRSATLVFWTVVAISALRGFRHREASRVPGTGLWLAAMAYGFGALLSEFAHGSFQERTIMLVAGLTVLWLVRDPGADRVVGYGKVLLGFFLLASVGLLLVDAPGASSPYGSSWIPGVDFRVNGATDHANRLGPLAVLYLVLERARPSGPLMRPLMTSTAIALLLLAQSKTAWAATAFVLVVHWAGQPGRRRVHHALAASMLVALGVFAFAFADAPDEPIVAPERLETARTLTGRTAVWQFGVEAWLEDPVWGTGPGIFREYAAATGQDWAGQAHNQYIQTLGEHGVVGGIGLVVYVLALATYAARNARHTRFVSVSLAGVVLVRTLTEAAMDRISLEHILLFALLLAWERERLSQPRAPSGTRLRTAA